MADAEWTYKELLWQDPDRVSGALCFYGTRVPVEILFANLEGGESLERFLVNYPSVSREQAVETIELSRVGLLKLVGLAA